MSSRDKAISVTAPGKIILFGEHAAVYGKPALGVPVRGVFASVSATPADTAIFAAGTWAQSIPGDIPKDAIREPLLRMAQITADYLGVPIPPAHYEIASSIPVASGLGSGAAVSAAVGRAIAAVANKPLTDDELNPLVYEIECIHHGTPSGIDNTIIVYGKPIYFVRNFPSQPFQIAQPLHLLIADTGRSALTKESVGDVRKLVEAQPDFAFARIEKIAEVVEMARAALADGNIATVGRLMGENHALLRDLTVSSPELENLVAAALDSGALGAKLSGGGRGGNMIALVTPETQDRVSAALKSAGAVRVISTTVD